MRHLTVLVALAWACPCLCLAADAVAKPEKALPIPGEVFLVKGRTAFLILPEKKAVDRPIPWIWYAPTLPGLPAPEEKWMFEKFLAAGVAVAGVDVGESYGSPAGRAGFTDLYEELVTRRGMAKKPCLLARSRGGLQLYNWAAEHPDCVAGVAGIYPVCNPASWPGLERACGAYGLSAEQLKAELSKHSPIERLEPLAKAGVPLFHIHGDNDKVVPLEANSGELAKRYEALGGNVTLKVMPGRGHDMWQGWFQCQELVDFAIARATGVPAVALTIKTPSDLQVFQRRTRLEGVLCVQGTVKGDCDAIEWRLTGKSLSGELPGKSLSGELPGKSLFGELPGKSLFGELPGEWKSVAYDPKTGAFQGEFPAAAGGWYRFEARALRGGAEVGRGTVERVGVGEVFIVAGQSNAGNYGAEKLKTATGLVSSFDGANWHLAEDPQRGADGPGGSFMPPFGDALVARCGVPVAVVPVAVGATSVRQWLPKGARMQQPPTTGANVTPVGPGQWECTGALFDRLAERLKYFGPSGVRAILWHQGESDAGQARSGYPASVQITGKQYTEFLAKLIRASREQARWDVPWMVALATIHTPTEAPDEEFRAAQKAVCDVGLAVEGPDSDALNGDNRTDVHFSGKGLRAHGKAWAEKVGAWLDKRLQQ